MSNKQKLEELEATVKNVLVEINKLKNSSGFNWVFKSEDTNYSADSDGEFWASSDNDDRYRIKYVNQLKTKEYCIQSARFMAWNSILFKLAEYFNPDGWEWVVGSCYFTIRFDHNKLELLDNQCLNHDYMTAKFHPDVIEDVIEELNNNKSEWWHLVTDKKQENTCLIKDT